MMYFVAVETKKAITIIVTACFSGESAGVRTRDPNIKSVVLYLLSYGFSEYQCFRVWWCKDSNYFYSSKIVGRNLSFIPIFVRNGATTLYLLSAALATSLHLLHALLEVATCHGLHHLACLLKLLEETVDIRHSSARTLSDTLAAAGVDNLGALTLSRGHRVDDSLGLLEGIVWNVDILEHLTHTRNH